MNTQIQTLSFDTLPVQFSSDAFLNATAIAKHFKKRAQHYLDSDRTKEYIDALAQHLAEKSKAAKTAFNEKQLVIVKSGAPETGGGTWLHPKLAIDFARWLNPKFAVWCDEQIENLLNPTTQLPQITRETRLPCSLESYANKLIAYLAKSQGVPAQELRHRLQEQFNHGKPLHEIRGEWAAYTYANLVNHLHEELDKLPVVDFGVSRKDLLNIFQRQCDYKRQFENWNDYQLQSWLDEQFFRNRREHYLGYPTSLESASYTQLTVLVDKMKHILGADFKLLDTQNVQTAAPPRALLIDAADAVWDLYQLARHTEVIVETVQDFLAEDRPNMVTAHLSMLNDLVQKALNIDADTINSDLNRYLAA